MKKTNAPIHSKRWLIVLACIVMVIWTCTNLLTGQVQLVEKSVEEKKPCLSANCVQEEKKVETVYPSFMREFIR